MPSFLKGKIGVVLLALLSLAAITVLASGLQGVPFRPGVFMGSSETQTFSLPIQGLLEDISGIPLWKQILIWGILFLIVLLLSMMLSPELRRQLIRMFLRFTLIAAAIFFLAQNYSSLFKGVEIFNGSAAAAQATPSYANGVSPPTFEPPKITPLLIFMVSAAVALVLAALLWIAQRWWKRRQDLIALRRTPEDLAEIAHRSLDQLSRGSAWEDVIVESYVRMSEAVEKRRGLTRKQDVTPSEFAAYLEKAGVPGDAVRTLTRLFESVRYGARRSTTDENEQAVTCLTAILNYCTEIH